MIFLFLVFVLGFAPSLFFSCSKNNLRQNLNPNDYVDEFDEFEFGEVKSNTDEVFGGEKLSLDLTKMSATMVYAEVFNMLVMPDKYDGKLIKVRGNFSRFVPNGKTEEVTTVVVSDALACCQQGLEFKITPGSPLENQLKNQNFPEPDSEIEIIGRFVLSQTEEGFDYFYLDLKNLEPL